MKKVFGLFFALLLLYSCEGFLEKLSNEKSLERLIKNLRIEKKGKVIELFSPRREMNPTHFVLNTGDTIIPSNSNVMLFVKKGDSIYKKELDNNILIFKADSLFKKTWLYKIPQKYRDNKEFLMNGKING